MAQVQVVFNNCLIVGKKFQEELDNRIVLAADACREFLKDRLAEGGTIENDTRAASESLYVQTEKGSDYAPRLAAARAAYLNNPSHWQDAVRQFVTSEAYTEEHFAERVLGEENLPAHGKEVAMAAVASMLAYLTMWEIGHQNVFTGRYEQRPWMEQAAFDWGMSEMVDHFKGML